MCTPLGPAPVGDPGGRCGGTGRGAGEPSVHDAASSHSPGQVPQAASSQQDLTGSQPQQGPGGEGPLLGLRSAIILVLGVLVASAAGVLTYRAQQDPATAALTAGGAFAGGVLFFQKIIAG
ncbi:hypothetical protein PUR25_02060 [Streptomyces sp. JV181]|uniref:hypothetical protein n=1 Tax=Streptomyces sp. JV181 TaxID=858635 RepID=UPI002E75D138|nr:hypothetical protein [Streptomyces sp. JV181]MEE1774873.1 hypothetical protein [Streptomyces sp. JV181]